MKPLNVNKRVLLYYSKSIWPNLKKITFMKIIQHKPELLIMVL